MAIKISQTDIPKICNSAITTPLKDLINKNHTSYKLKHLAEQRAKILSDNEINYITNGALILAMVDAGFRFQRDGDSPNVCFNVSERSLKKLSKSMFGFNTNLMYMNYNATYNILL